MNRDTGEFWKFDFADPVFAERMFNEMPIATIVVDKTGLIAAVNDQAEFLFGYSKAEMMGQAVEMLMPEAARKQHMKDRQKFRANPSKRPMGYPDRLAYLRGVCKDGDEFPILVNLSPMVSKNGVFYMAMIQRRDISTEAEYDTTLNRESIRAEEPHLKSPELRES